MRRFESCSVNWRIAQWLEHYAVNVEYGMKIHDLEMPTPKMALVKAVRG
ncbi:MAG: hypothetical protein ACMVP2_07120 [Imperialibacter sp.]